jgi:hypothetical protein
VRRLGRCTSIRLDAKARDLRAGRIAADWELSAGRLGFSPAEAEPHREAHNVVCIALRRIADSVLLTAAAADEVRPPT